MRKNTLIKLLAVLAMCFVIGATLVACSDNEEPVDTAKSVVSVSFNGGKLVIAYDDSSTESIDLPAPATCEHKREILSVEVEKHTASANGTYIDVCSDCGYTWIKYEKRHTWVDDVITVDPTCTAGGYTIKSYCSGCKLLSEKTNIVDPIDHKWDDGVYVGGNVCVAGGEIVYTCTYGCGETKKEPVEAAANEGIDGQHTVDTWEITIVPTLTTKGLITGKCTVCPETVTHELVEFTKATDDNYTVVPNARTSCREDATATVTYKKETSVVIENAVIEKAGEAHMLYNKNGEKVFLYPTEIDADGNPVYKYNKADFEGIKEFANTPINSCKPTLAYYVCAYDFCNATVDIYAYADHNWQSIGSDVRVCGEEAFEHFQCPDCLEKKDESLGTREHVFDYIGLKNESAVANDCTAFSYEITCKQPGCDYYEKKDLTAADVTIDTEKTPVTCENDGKIYVSYTVPGTEVVLECVETIPMLGHVLNGQIMIAATTGGDAPTAGETVYKWYEGCGVTVFADKDITSGESVLGWFICDHTAESGDTHRVPVWVNINAGETIAPVVSDVPAEG